MEAYPQIRQEMKVICDMDMYVRLPPRFPSSSD